MVDVKDKMASALPRSRTLLGREGSNLGPNNSSSTDLKEILKKVEPLPRSSTLSSKEVDEILHTTIKMVGEASVDWTKKLTLLKTFRSLCQDQNHHTKIISYLRQLLPPMELAVKDLRSQVGREACITVAYLTLQLGLKVEFFIEPLLPTLFTLLVATAKVVSMTSCSTIFIIYESVHSSRLIPTLQTQLLTKSKEVHRVVCDVLKIILNTWPTNTILKQTNIIQEMVKKGLTNPDLVARVSTREAFPAFQNIFPGLACTILDSLDPIQRRQMLRTGGGGIDGTLLSSRKENIPTTTQGMNGAGQHTATLTRQSSLKKTNIPVLAPRVTPGKSKPLTQGRSASAIDLQAANRAKQHHLSTVKTPIRYFERSNTMAMTTTTTPKFSTLPKSKSPGPNSLTFSHSKLPPHTATPVRTSSEKRRTRSPISKISHSQPGSRSNSPSSLQQQLTYNSPHTSSNSDNSPVLSSISRYGTRRIRRASETSSASSSRDTSPKGQIIGMRHKSSSRSVSNSPQILSLVNKENKDSVTAKRLLASIEADSVLSLSDDLPLKTITNVLEVEYGGSGNYSDSEDSMNSHRSPPYMSENISPSSTTRRHLYIDDEVEELLNKCGNSKLSERKEGLLGLQNYLQRYGSIPSQHFSRIGQTFCHILIDAHTKILSLFLDVLHAILYRHGRDLIDFTTILLNRILTKIGSDLHNSVHMKLMKTLEILMEEMPSEIQFSAVTHYLCDPTQIHNTKSKIAALTHVINLSYGSISVKTTELEQLVDKILDWCIDIKSQDIHYISQETFYSLYSICTPQITIILNGMSSIKQDQAKGILKYIETQETSTINSIPISCDLINIVSQILITPGGSKCVLLAQLCSIIKDSSDSVLIEHHKYLLKGIFDALSDNGKPLDKVCCFYCLEQMCDRHELNESLGEFTELFLVHITNVFTLHMPREVTKGAENCGMAIAENFTPEIIVRSLCPIVHNNDNSDISRFAIKMLQRVCDTCELSKLKVILSDIITTLIEAYDHPDSAVRTSAVFAIVAVHCRLGSELEPYLASLSGSKLKLLQSYIQRAQKS